MYAVACGANEYSPGLAKQTACSSCPASFVTRANSSGGVQTSPASCGECAAAQRPAVQHSRGLTTLVHAAARRLQSHHLATTSLATGWCRARGCVQHAHSKLSSRSQQQVALRAAVVMRSGLQPPCTCRASSRRSLPTQPARRARRRGAPASQQLARHRLRAATATVSMRDSRQRQQRGSTRRHVHARLLQLISWWAATPVCGPRMLRLQSWSRVTRWSTMAARSSQLFSALQA